MSRTILIIFIMGILIASPSSGDTAEPTSTSPQVTHCREIRLGSSRIWFARFDYETSDWSGQIKKYGTHTRFAQIYAVSRQTVFLAGDCAVPGGPVRSVLLKTRDGGKTWWEVKHPKSYNYTSEIVFVDDQNGWVMDSEILEGAGPATLFITHNGGRSWQSLGTLPWQSQGSFMTLGLDFTTRFEGSVWTEMLTRQKGREGNTDFCRFDTNDGGKSWESSDTCCPRDVYLFNYKPANTVRALKDDSIWRLERFKVDLLDGRQEKSLIFIISMKSDKDAPWQQVVLIPANLKLEDGWCDKP